MSPVTPDASRTKFLARHVLAVALAAVLVGVGLSAQAPPVPASPEGKAQAQVGGSYVQGARGQSYQGGKWIEVTYGRPLLRGRTNIFGSGADYGKGLLVGAPIWRAGANVSTRLRTEAMLMIGSKMINPGEYSVFIDLKETAWTFVLSSWDAQRTYDPSNRAALWGAFNYTPDKDVVRAPMKRSKNALAVDQLTWNFVNMTGSTGELAISWDKEIATVPFMVH